MKQSRGDLLSFNNFLSASTNEKVSLSFANQWQINLTTTNDNDQQLKNLTEQIRKETWEPGWIW